MSMKTKTREHLVEPAAAMTMKMAYSTVIARNSVSPNTNLLLSNKASNTTTLSILLVLYIQYQKSIFENIVNFNLQSALLVFY